MAPAAGDVSEFVELVSRRWRLLSPAWEHGRQIHPGGERMFVDYAGQTVPVVDAATGEIREQPDTYDLWCVPSESLG